MELEDLKIGDVVEARRWAGYYYLAEIVEIDIKDCYPIGCLIPANEWDLGWKTDQFYKTVNRINTISRFESIKFKLPSFKLKQHNYWILSLDEVVRVIPELTW